jgi:hypothetical protein
MSKAWIEKWIGGSDVLLKDCVQMFLVVTMGSTIIMLGAWPIWLMLWILK